MRCNRKRNDKWICCNDKIEEENEKITLKNWKRIDANDERMKRKQTAHVNENIDDEIELIMFQAEEWTNEKENETENTLKFIACGLFN